MSGFNEDAQLHLATLKDADAIHHLEAESYPAEEGASYEQIVYRIQHANEFFYVLKVGEAIIGFVNGTCICESTVHHESMSRHHPEGRTLVIHSVTIRSSYRKKKLASYMLQQYVRHIAQLKKINLILLLSKSYLLPLYLQNGFQYAKVSSVVHGQEQWHELSLNVREHFGIDQWIVDAFAAKPFTGNPAAVVLTQGSETWMQSVATENNYAETSFVRHIKDNLYHLRW
jgi:GNAT superfamily N-acetyltransferase